jgi:hypothetical protein
MGKYQKFILEALVIDTISNISREDKSLLNLLHKLYGGKSSWMLDVNEIIDFMEEMGYSYTKSLKMVTYYKKNRDLLFTEYSDIDSDVHRSKILYNFLGKYLADDKFNKWGDRVKEKVDNSEEFKKYGDKGKISTTLWQHYGDQIGFFIFNYINYQSPLNWSCLITYSFKDLEKMDMDVDTIPLKVGIKNIEGNFPVPELEGSFDMINIPIDFDVEEMGRKDVEKILLGDNNSITSDLVERLDQIMSFID